MGWPGGGQGKHMIEFYSPTGPASGRHSCNERGSLRLVRSHPMCEENMRGFMRSPCCVRAVAARLSVTRPRLLHVILSPSRSRGVRSENDPLIEFRVGRQE